MRNCWERKRAVKILQLTEMTLSASLPPKSWTSSTISNSILLVTAPPLLINLTGKKGRASEISWPVLTVTPLKIWSFLVYYSWKVKETTTDAQVSYLKLLGQRQERRGEQSTLWLASGSITWERGGTKSRSRFLNCGPTGVQWKRISQGYLTINSHLGRSWHSLRPRPVTSLVKGLSVCLKPCSLFLCI